MNMSKVIKDLIKVSVRAGINEGEIEEYHLEGRFKDSQKYVVAVFDEECEGMADEVAAMINDSIKALEAVKSNSVSGDVNGGFTEDSIKAAYKDGGIHGGDWDLYDVDNYR